MTSPTDLMEGRLIQRERVPGSAVRTQEVLYFRADKVIKRMQEHNACMQEISDRLAKAVEKHKARKALLDQAGVTIAYMPCRCTYLGEGETIQCARCQWLEDYRAIQKEDTNGGT